MKLGYLPCYVGKSIFPFDLIFDESLRIDDPIKVMECDAIVLWGGEDIASRYYGEDPHPMNQNSSGKPSARDAHEWSAMCVAQNAGVPIIGVCRGAQFLTAFAGGTLNQHMAETGHHRPHMVETYDGKVYQSSSCHHQAMLPAGTNHEVLAKHKDGTMEVVYYPKVKGLAIQGHPEWMEYKDLFVEWCMREIKARVLTPATV